MIVAIHRDHRYLESYADRWAESLRARGVTVRPVDLTAPDALAQVAGCDGVMWRWGHLPEDTLSAARILHAIELTLDIPVFPDHRTAWHFDEKLTQHYLLAGAGVPTPPTWVFWERETARAWAAVAEYPKVFKLSAGASGMNVTRVDSRAEAEGLIDRMFGPGIHGGRLAPAAPATSDSSRASALVRGLARRGRAAARGLLGRRPSRPPPAYWRLERGYAYFQEWVPDNAFDVRVAVIGDRAWAYRRFPYPGDFRASVAGGPRDFDPAAIDVRHVALAVDVSRRLGVQCMAYDMMLLHGRPVVLELSYAFGWNLVPQCPGHWNGRLEWVPGTGSVYEAQVEDFLQGLAARAAEMC